MFSKLFNSLIKKNVTSTKLHLYTGKINYRSFHENSSNPNIKKIKLVKRLASTLLFGGTFVIVILAKKRNRNSIFNEASLVNTSLYHKNFKLYEYKGYVLPSFVMKNLNAVRSFSCKDDDIFVVSFPKTGTTWVQEIIYCILKGIDNASSKTMEDRFPYLEFIYPGLASVAKLPEPRMVKTHLPYSLLPQEVYTKKPKIFYVMRNIKDISVSYYHFVRMMTVSDYSGSFENFFTEFLSDKVPYGPIWKHYLEIWEQKDEENIFIICYEDLHKDIRGNIKKIALFLNVNLTENEIDHIAEHCSFNNMSNNPNVNYQHWDDLGIRKKSESKFMRKGVVGDWKNYLNLEMNKLIDSYIEEHLKDIKNIHSFDDL